MPKIIDASSAGEEGHPTPGIGTLPERRWTCSVGKTHLTSCEFLIQDTEICFIFLQQNSGSQTLSCDNQNHKHD